MFAFSHADGKIPVSRHLSKIRHKGSTIESSHIFILAMEISSHP